ncbi:10971_t:CDS:2, partial [Gigaspora margarita]
MKSQFPYLSVTVNQNTQPPTVFEHNHAADVSQLHVAKMIAKIKEQMQQSNDKPSQIAQDVIANSSYFVYQYLLSSNTIHQTIQRIRHLDLPTEPLSLESLVIPQNMRTTLIGMIDLLSGPWMGPLRQSLLCSDNYTPFMVFFMTFIFFIISSQNSEHGHYLEFWCAGGSDNSRIMPLVFALMTSKTEELYRRMFQELLDFAEENGINLFPQMVLTDFESAAINAIKSEFEDAQYKGCHFHLAQSVYRKIQTSGLAICYRTDQELSLLIRHISALAFLSS